MNIPQDIMEFGQNNGLSFLSTGGGTDYIVNNSINGYVLVLKDTEDSGSPDSLTSAAEVCVYSKSDEDWSEPFSKQFKTAKAAMIAMTEDVFKNEMVAASIVHSIQS